MSLKSKFTRCDIIFPMIKILLIIVIFLIGANEVSAYSKANVKVSNNVSGSSSSNIESNTNITVETDGQTTTYSSDKPGNIEVNSINGKSEIKVNGITVSENNNKANSIVSPSVEPTAKPKNIEQKNKNIFDFFGNLFRKILLLF